MFKENLTFILCFSATVLFQINEISGATSGNVFLNFFDFHDPKIINGTEANVNTTRHQVSIRRRLQDSYFFGTGHICGGSLVSENVVLTAAHCIVNYDVVKPNGTFLPEREFIVVMGNLDRFESNNNTLIFDIVKIIKRVEIFNLTSFDEDIALIMLNGTVPSKHPTVRPIILNGGALEENTTCQATGWGKTEDDYLSDILRTVDLPIIDTDDCRKTKIYGSFIHEGMMCAGYLKGERDACQGDSGGPLVCHGIQAGIVSWGFGCAEPLRPGVYTDVAYFKNWILKEVANHNGTLPKFSGRPGDGNNGANTSRNSSMLVVSAILIFNWLYSKYC